MDLTELHYAMALQAVPKIGDITAKKLIRHCGSPEAVFKSSKASLLAIGGIGTVVVKAIQSSKAAALLLNLELKGVVRPLPGKRFELS